MVNKENLPEVYDCIGVAFAALQIIYDDNRETILDYCFVQTNKACESIFNDEIIGKTVKFVIPKIDNCWMKYCEKAALGNIESVSFNYPMIIEDKKRYFRVTAIHSTPEVLLLIFYEYTNFKELVEKFQESSIEVNKLNKLKAAFLSNMSHEVRTPLNAIIGFSCLISKESENPKFDEYLPYIKNGGEQLLNLINDILDLSKIESGNVTITEQEVDLEKFLYGIKKQFENNSKGIEIKVNIDTSLEEKMIMLDQLKITQILNKLVTNALKFTSEGFIEIGAKRKKREVVFWVKDTGIGIAREKQKLIFENFTQADEKIAINYGGIGLGLSIIKGLIRVMDGKIDVESEESIGSTFFFSLPYKRMECYNKEITVPKKHYTLKEKNILVVEGSGDQQYINVKLASTGATVFVARDAKQAMNVFVEEKLDIVLMSIKLPGKDGFHIFQDMREIDGHIPIIALAKKEANEKWFSIGFTDYISEPYSNDYLIEIIRKHIL